MRPVLQVTADGKPVSGVFYSELKNAHIHDESGQESGSFEAEFSNEGGRIALPREGTVLSVISGWFGAQLRFFGDFTVAGYVAGRNVDDGRYIRMTARPADLREDLKAPGTEHWDHATLGQIITDLAERHGLQAAIDPALASIQIPYFARVEQSVLDVGTRLADRFNAVSKIAAGRMVFALRGGTTISGGRLAQIVVNESHCSEWSVQGEPRPRFGSTAAKWLDRSTGKIMLERAAGGVGGPTQVLRTVFASKAEAAAAAQSEMTNLNRNTGSGSLTLSVGRPYADPEADLVLQNFGPGADGLWRVTATDHVFSQGYQTGLQFEAPEEGGPGNGKTGKDGGGAGGGSSGFASGFDGSAYMPGGSK